MNILYPIQTHTRTQEDAKKANEPSTAPPPPIVGAGAPPPPPPPLMVKKFKWELGPEPKKKMKGFQWVKLNLINTENTIFKLFHEAPLENFTFPWFVGRGPLSSVDSSLRHALIGIAVFGCACVCADVDVGLCAFV